MVLPLAWGASAMLGSSLWWPLAAAAVLDFGLRSTHAANQSAAYRAAPASRSRITAALCSWALDGRAVPPAAAEGPDLVGPFCHTVGHDQD